MKEPKLPTKKSFLITVFAYGGSINDGMKIANCSREYAHDIAKTLNIKFPKRFMTGLEKLEALALIYSGEPYKRVAYRYGVSVAAIAMQAKLGGYRRYRNKECII